MQEGPRKSPSFMIQSYKASSQGLTQTTIWPGWLLQVTQNKCPHGLLLNSGEDQQRLLPPAALCLNLSWPQPEIRSDVRAYWAQPCSETQLSSGSSQIFSLISSLIQASPTLCLARHVKFPLGSDFWESNHSPLCLPLPALPSTLFSSSAGKCHTSMTQGLGSFLAVFCPSLIQNLVQMLSWESLSCPPTSSSALNSLSTCVFSSVDIS